MNTGKAISDLRIVRGMKQCQLAKKAGISQTSISLIESNKTNPEKATIKKIAKALGVDEVIIIFRSLEETDVKPKLQGLFKKLSSLINEC